MKEESYDYDDDEVKCAIDELNENETNSRMLRLRNCLILTLMTEMEKLRM